MTTRLTDDLWDPYREILSRIEGALRAAGLGYEFENEIHFLWHMYRKLGVVSDG